MHMRQARQWRRSVRVGFSRHPKTHVDIFYILILNRFCLEIFIFIINQLSRWHG